MSLADELLDTAKYLLRRNKNKPSQADIRRSISTVYYSLFHRLIEDATSYLLVDTVQQQALARTFSHAIMKEVCELVTKQPLPPLLVPFFGTSVPEELKQVAETFVDLQEWRHDADYDLSLTITRNQGRERIDDLKEVFAAWKLVPASIAHPFLLILLIGKRSLR
jgi:hypothetical protein